MLEKSKTIARSLFGSGFAREGHRIELRTFNDYKEAYTALERTSKETYFSESSTQPIFILSAGWRSGSTLMQRLICSDDAIFMWGEPFDKSNIIQSLASMLSPFSNSWPPEEYIYTGINTKEAKNLWVANLYPETTDLLAAHRQFLDALFQKPSKKIGYSRWGIKEVRFGLKEALYLKLLYPDAKFIYLKRDLIPAYRSYASFSKKMNWYSSWPDGKAFTPYSFAKHRARLIAEFDDAISTTGGIIVDYDELTQSENIIKKIKKYCDANINESILYNKVGSGHTKEKEFSLTVLDKLLLKVGNKAF